MDRSDFKYIEDKDDSEGWKSDPFRDLRLEVPIGDVTDEPRQCVEISREWVPFIVGALERLKFGDMWDATADDMRRVDGNISTLQTMIGEGDCDSGSFDYQCNDFPLYAPNIDWLPADPFHEPNKVPLGYTLPPFVIAEFDEPLNGIRAGDVLIGAVGSLISFPPVVPLSGVPRLQIAVQGPATVDIGFARVLQGGIAIVFVDGLPNHWVDLQLYNAADLLNVNSWAELFGFAFNTFTGAKLQDEIELNDDKEYVIEVQFFPRPALDYSLGYGGGIRSIEICSAKEQIDLSGVVQDVRINNGTIEKFIEGLWEGVTVADNDDVLTETDLRGENCQLEYYDLETSSWLPVPGADFLSVTEPCPILAPVEISTDFYPQFKVKQAGDTDYLVVQKNPTSGGMFATDFLWLGHADYKASMFAFPEGKVILSTNAATVPNYGAVTIDNDLGQTTLSLRSLLSNPANTFQVIDKDGYTRNRLTSEGYFYGYNLLALLGLSSTGTPRTQANITSEWANSTDAVRRARLKLAAADWNTAREAMRIEADGLAARVGFFGVNAVNRPVLTGADWQTVLTEMLVSLDDLGLVDNQTSYDAENPIQESEVVPTYFESYWDWTTYEPIPQEWGASVGTWVEGEGLTEDNTGPHSRIEISRLIHEKQNTLKLRLRVNVANLTGGQVHLEMWHAAPTPDALLWIANQPEQIEVHDLPVERFGESDTLWIYIYTDDGETADIAVEAVWEQGLGLPVIDRHLYSTETNVFSGVPELWSTP